MSVFLQNLRYAVRSLRKSPGFTAVTVATLALGIGASTAIFSVVESVLLRPLAFRRPDRLVTVWESDPAQGYDENAVAAPVFENWRRGMDGAFAGIAACTIRETSAVSGGTGAPERVDSARVTPGLIALLGVAPASGREFAEADGDAVAAISDGLWRRRFGGDPAIVGRTILVDGRRRTVVAVMPPGFEFPGATGLVLDRVFNPRADLWLPLVFTASENSQFSNHWLQVIGRLADGVSPRSARARLDAVQAGIRRTRPLDFVGARVTMVSLPRQVGRGVAPALRLLLAAVGFVLLIACANVAHLSWARALGRGRDFAIRTALGAGRRRLVLEELTGSAVLAAASGALGVALAAAGLPILRRLVPPSVPRGGSASIDGAVVAFAAGAALLTLLLVGLAPALRGSAAPIEALKEGATGAGGGRHRRRARFLSTGEAALALVLLIGTALTIESLRRLERVDPGFRPDHVWTARLSMPEARYPHREDRARFVTRLADALRGLPGFAATGTVTDLPLSGDNMNFALRREDRSAPARSEISPSADYRAVTAGYFAAMGIAFLRGRGFSTADADRGAPMVFVVNRHLVRRYFGGEDPIGRRIRIGVNDVSGEIVGVVDDVRHEGLDADAGDEVYGLYARTPFWGRVGIAVRSALPPADVAAGVRRAVAAIDPELPLADARTMDDALQGSAAQPRFRAALLAVFATVALLLAAIGIAAQMGSFVSARTREIAVRVALGGRPRDIFGLVVGEGMRSVVLGIAIGLPLAAGAARLIASFLFGIGPVDPATYVAVPVFLSAVALVACAIPARRAARIDPMAALRTE